MFADNTEEKIEDIVNNSDDEQPVVKHKIVTPPPVKNKKRKLVDKTYEDEEGFISIYFQLPLIQFFTCALFLSN